MIIKVIGYAWALLGSVMVITGHNLPAQENTILIGFGFVFIHLPTTRK